MRAADGRGDVVQDLLLRVAAALATVDGCELYVVHRSVTEPDTIWVTESWASQEALQGSGDAVPADTVSPAQVLAELTGPPEVIAVTPIGGVGLPPA